MGRWLYAYSISASAAALVQTTFFWVSTDDVFRGQARSIRSYSTRNSFTAVFDESVNVEFSRSTRLAVACLRAHEELLLKVQIHYQAFSLVAIASHDCGGGVVRQWSGGFTYVCVEEYHHCVDQQQWRGASRHFNSRTCVSPLSTSCNSTGVFRITEKNGVTGILEGRLSQRPEL